VIRTCTVCLQDFSPKRGHGPGGLSPASTCSAACANLARSRTKTGSKYAKRFQCRDCGKPCGRAGTSCSTCSARRRQERQRKVLKASHARLRPTPAPIPQHDPSLPPLGQLIHDDDGSRLQCHICGCFYAGLSSHVRQSHGIAVADYKESFGLARGLSLWAPQYREKQRQAALSRQQGDAHRLQPNPRPGGLANRLSSRLLMSEAHELADSETCKHRWMLEEPVKESPTQVGGTWGRCRLCGIRRFHAGTPAETPDRPTEPKWSHPGTLRSALDDSGGPRPLRDLRRARELREDN